MKLFYNFTINAARRLPKLPPEHICSQLHGHTFRIEVCVDGAIDPASGWVMDFSDLETPAKSVQERLEHQYLNDIAGLDNPTSENLAVWIWNEIAQGLAGLCEVKVMEGPDRGCVYQGSLV